MRDEDLADRLTRLRKARGLTLEDLAASSGVSRASLSRIERAQISPTAATLGRLAAAFGLSVAELFAGVAVSEAALQTREAQAVWRDPETGFVRRVLSPSTPGFRGSLIEGCLPAGAEIAYPVPPVADLEHHLVLLEGVLELSLADETYRLKPGDGVRFRLRGPSRYRATGARAARYILCAIAP
ncbi:XRE family transcriptional regulator [Stappia sp.]|uniref:XRE family transcriptional regulator n=1 Tax=Stappia sp. TaxID=1870903 RepID=UPI0032D9AD25